jgi:hypothetical protein
LISACTKILENCQYSLGSFVEFVEGSGLDARLVLDFEAEVFEDAEFLFSGLFYHQHGAEDADWVFLRSDLEDELLGFRLCGSEAMGVAVGGGEVERLELVVWG